MSAPLRVVVSGASSGIGAAIALAFADKGARLVLAARGREGLEAIAARCRAAGGDAHVVPLDATEPDAAPRLAQEAAGVLGSIDLWVSVVGVGVLGRFADVPMADHARVIDANLLSHMREAHAAIPLFLAQGHGIWVNMISVGGFVATPWAAAYAASKFGLRGFSQALRAELKGTPGLYICDVYPTFVDTPGVDHAGNYSGAALGLPPGALSPATVARAVVRLAKRPRATTVVGAPALAMRLGQFVAPDLMPRMMDHALAAWAAQGEPASATPGALFDAGQPLGADGGRRRPLVRRGVALGLAAAGTVAAAGIGLALSRRDRT